MGLISNNLVKALIMDPTEHPFCRQNRSECFKTDGNSRNAGFSKLSGMIILDCVDGFPRLLRYFNNLIVDAKSW